MLWHRRYPTDFPNEAQAISAAKWRWKLFWQGGRDEFPEAPATAGKLQMDPCESKIGVKPEQCGSERPATAAKLLLRPGEPGWIHGCAFASLPKRGSLRNGSNIGSSRSNAGVSGGFAANGASYGIESSFSNVEMERSGSPIRAATRARISSGLGPVNVSFSIGIMAIARSARASAAVLSPRLMLVSARSPSKTKFSGCSLRKGSSSVRASLQLSRAAALSPATSCAQPNQKRSSPL